MTRHLNNTVQYIVEQFDYLKKVYRIKDVNLRYTRVHGAWLEDRKTIVIGRAFLVKKERALLPLIHELGHLASHTYKGVRGELAANRWALKCIEKHYKDNLALKKEFFEYLESLLYTGENPHSQAAYDLLISLKFKVLKNSKGKFKLIPPKRYIF